MRLNVEFPLVTTSLAACGRPILNIEEVAYIPRAHELKHRPGSCLAGQPLVFLQCPDGILVPLLFVG